MLFHEHLYKVMASFKHSGAMLTKQFPEHHGHSNCEPQP